jgi:hypothetical protein
MKASPSRMEIYATLGVPEVWRVAGGKLRIYCRNFEGIYDEAAKSPTFPSLPLGEVLALFEMCTGIDGLSQTRAIRDWGGEHRH